MKLSRRGHALNQWNLLVMLSLSLIVAGCSSGSRNVNEPGKAANLSGVKAGTVTGDMIFSGDGVFMVVKLDDGPEVSVGVPDPGSERPLTKGDRVELEAIRDAKHGEWKLIRVVKPAK